MIYDGGKIITGLVIGVGLLLAPFFYNAGKAAKAPEPKLTPKAKEAKVCVAPTDYMRTNHMHLLDKWRNEVVREDIRYFKTAQGKVFYKGLQGTCLQCHSNKTKFCDECHNYLDVQPYCWDCHLVPKENK